LRPMSHIARPGPAAEMAEAVAAGRPGGGEGADGGGGGGKNRIREVVTRPTMPARRR
jgi:hypothetical protein